MTEQSWWTTIQLILWVMEAGCGLFVLIGLITLLSTLGEGNHE